MMKIKIAIIIFSFIIFAGSASAYIFEPTVIDGKEYISINDLCEVFGISFDPQLYPAKMVFYNGDETITLLPLSPRLMVSALSSGRGGEIVNRVYTLEFPAKFRNGVIFIPIGFIGKAFGADALENLKKNKGLKIKTIVIDAGHGGYDPGAIGPNGLMEKEINLDLAYKVYHLLNSHLPVKVLLSRKEDVFVPLHDRTKFADSNGVDLFVSIHCNAAFSQKMKGSETYFVSPASDPGARAVEVLENSVINLEFKESKITKDNYAAAILQDMAYFEFVRESSIVAGYVQNSLVDSLKLENRGVKQALFYVLRGVAAPSILIEVAFLSYPEEEAKLASEAFRRQAAEAIFSGIKEYLMAGNIKK